MKRILLSLSLIILLAIKANAGNQINFSGTLFYNSTNNTITVQYYITNTSTNGSGGGCGNSNINVAVIYFGLQWNSSVVTLSSWNFFPSGKGLDSTEYFDGGPGTADDIPDATVSGTRTVNPGSKSFSTLNFTRSTNLCDNTIVLACNQTVLLFQAVFTIPPALAGTYDYTHPNDNTNYPNYIAEFNDGTSNTSNAYKEILFISTRPFDSPGSSCPPGTALGNNVNNLPDDVAADVFVNTNGAILPVNIEYFEAYKQNNKVSLNWATSSELANRGFEVQRKTGNTFETIGFVPAKSDGGYSNGNLTYNFIDPSANNGTTYYRLKQLSYLSKETYSEIKAIGNQRQLQVLVYPNPSNGKLNIVLPQGNGTTDINMIDFSGKLIRSWNGIKTSNLQLTGLQRGIYTLLISSRETGEKVAQKITVQ